MLVLAFPRPSPQLKGLAVSAYPLGSDEGVSISAAQAETESLLRLAAVATTIEAIVKGHWRLDAKLAESLLQLVAAAAQWAQVAEGMTT